MHNDIGIVELYIKLNNDESFRESFCDFVIDEFEPIVK
jgi:hypothetical protein